MLGHCGLRSVRVRRQALAAAALCATPLRPQAFAAAAAARSRGAPSRAACPRVLLRATHAIASSEGIWQELYFALRDKDTLEVMGLTAGGGKKLFKRMKDGDIDFVDFLLV
ncbi:unnamed protein product, partial [Prorocentrum cordatum]